jgi:hypothetical protein
MELLLGEQIGGPDGFEQLRKLEMGAAGPVSVLSEELAVLEVPVAAAVPVFLVVAVVAVVSFGTATSTVVALPPTEVSMRAAVGAELEVVPVVVPTHRQ